MEHAMVRCSRSMDWYGGKNWSSQFTCGICGRHGRFSLNFLGGREVICDGEKFIKARRRDIEWSGDIVKSIYANLKGVQA